MLYGCRYCFILYIRTDYIYKDMAENVESRFDTSICELDRPLPKGKKSNWINERLVRQKKGDKKAKTKT